MEMTPLQWGAAVGLIWSVGPQVSFLVTLGPKECPLLQAGGCG